MVPPLSTGQSLFALGLGNLRQVGQHAQRELIEHGQEHRHLFAQRPDGLGDERSIRVDDSLFSCGQLGLGKAYG